MKKLTKILVSVIPAIVVGILVVGYYANATFNNPQSFVGLSSSTITGPLQIDAGTTIYGDGSNSTLAGGLNVGAGDLTMQDSQAMLFGAGALGAIYWEPTSAALVLEGSDGITNFGMNLDSTTGYVYIGAGADGTTTSSYPLTLDGTQMITTGGNFVLLSSGGTSNLTVGDGTNGVLGVGNGYIYLQNDGGDLRLGANEGNDVLIVRATSQNFEFFTPDFKVTDNDGGANQSFQASVDDASTTVAFGTDGNPTCLTIGDLSGAGLTYITAEDGVLTASTTPCFP